MATFFQSFGLAAFIVAIAAAIGGVAWLVLSVKGLLDRDPVSEARFERLRDDVRDLQNKEYARGK